MKVFVEMTMNVQEAEGLENMCDSWHAHLRGISLNGKFDPEKCRVCIYGSLYKKLQEGRPNCELYSPLGGDWRSDLSVRREVITAQT